MEITQYHVFLVNLDPTIGKEIKKTRPCLVISPDEMNRNLKTVVIAPMTTSLRLYPTRVSVRFSEKVVQVAIDQIRTIDKKRINKQLGTITNKEIKEVKSVIREAYVE